MNISDVFIKKPITTTLLTVVVVVMGVSAYFGLPVSSLPNVDSPVMTVSASYPGASPQTMASAVAGPLENELMSINGLQSIISDNTAGNTKITLNFELGKSVDLMAPDVQRAISAAQENLPSDLPSPPTYDKDNPSDQPVMYIMVTSDTLTPGDVYDYAYRYIGKRLSMIEGVSKVDKYGSKMAIRIQVHPEKLSSLGLSMADVQQAIKAGTSSLPGGSIDSGAHTFSIEPQGQLRHAAEFEKLIIKYVDGAPVYLRDVADCEDSIGNDKVSVRYGLTKHDKVWSGGTCLPVSRSPGANTVAVVQRINQTLDELRKEIPGSVQIDVLFDNSVSIVESINDVQTTIVVAIILVVLIIFLFLGRLRETFIPTFVIPVALLGSFIVMLPLGFSLDNLSLMAMVLSVGFLVDDAIVVLENTVRHVESGLKPIPASVKSMRELTFTVISTSISLIIVFVPLVFMAGVVGRNFQEFALTVIIAIVCSTLLALSLTPMMCSRILKPTAGHETMTQKVVGHLITGLTNKYAIALKFVLNHKWLSIIMWALCIGGTVMIFQRLPKDFIPPGDTGCAYGVMMTPMGSSYKDMDALALQVESIVMANTNVKNVLTVANPSLGADKSTGYIVLALHDKDRAPIDAVLQQLNIAFSQLSGGMVFLQPVPLMNLSAGGESTASGSKYSYAMRSNDRDLLYEMADKLEAKMRTLEGFQGIQTSVKLNLPQLNVNLDRTRASTFGISSQDILNALMAAYAQGRVTTFYTDNDTYNIIPQFVDAKSKYPVDLRTIYVTSPLTGEDVPLSTLVTWEETVGPQNVPHSQQLDSATISFNLAPGVPLGNATKALEAAAAEILPATVSGQLQGEAQEFQEAIKSLVVLLGVAVFLMYIVLGILYESYIHPFTVLTTLPVAAFGGVATLMIFGATCNLYAYIGLFMLLGIIAKNGIMMVDFAKQHLEENPGSTGFDAIYNACLIRFRPILMTGMSTIMGTMPIALGMGADGASRIPLGLIIVGGMLFAQVVTLFVTPGIYLYMQAIQEHMGSEKRNKELGMNDLKKLNLE
jgi:HAE1 family hydrophobic/amphiphilic exporter-1